MISTEKIEELKTFVAFLRKTPAAIHHPSLSFFKDYLIDLGATIPPRIQEIIPTESHQTQSQNTEPRVAAAGSASASPTTAPQQTGANTALNDELLDDMGDSFVKRQFKDGDDDVSDQIVEAKSNGAKAFAAASYKEAAIHYGLAIRLDRGRSAILFIKRAEALLHMKRYFSARRDSDRAIHINPDAGKAYRIRGTCFYHMDKLEEAVRDLRTANQLDFDVDANELQKTAEQKLRQRKQQKSTSAAVPTPQQHSTSNTSTQKPASSSTNWMTPELIEKVATDPELMRAFSEPRLMAAIEEVATNPHAFMKYKNEPDILKMFAKFSKLLGAGK